MKFFAVFLLLIGIQSMLMNERNFIKRNDWLSNKLKRSIVYHDVFYINKIIQEQQIIEKEKEKERQQKMVRENAIFNAYLASLNKGSPSIFRDFHTTRY